jgi:hypothetical protein
MSIWIVTTGNSDVQLKPDYNSNKWQKLYREVRSEFFDHLFEPYRLKNAPANEPYTVPARVMGMVYSPQLDDEIFQDLHFPLLDTFINGLTGKNQPDKIIVILTNQENVFSDDDKTNNKCPYWQDTYILKPILEKYFGEKFPRLKSNQDIQYLELKPNSKEEGLDNWDKCLILVNNLFHQEMANLEIREYTKIFVSHQAGTPAISSAVQFSSLAKFEKQVQFLVSNEYEPGNPIFIPSSNYLKGIKLQEAKELLKRYDYSGVDKILTEVWKQKQELLNVQEQKIKDLLAMAIQWNNANFDDFGKARSKIDTNAEEQTKKRWWTSYEAAYLAVIRLRQGNNLEALFHSFRAVEGLLRDMEASKYDHKGIHDLIETVLSDWKLSEDIRIFKDYTSKQRNNLFHNLLGLQQEEVFQAWNTNSNKEWQKRVRRCLDFITKQQFLSLEQASLMSSVHQELEAAINNYELQT